MPDGAITYRCVKRYKYQTTAGFEVYTPIVNRWIRTDFLSLDIDGRLWIRQGYAWNGASGPVRDNAKTLAPSLVHDAFYQLLRAGLLPISMRGRIDRLFGEHCEAMGTRKSVARFYVWGLKHFGKRAATNDDDPIERSAPAP